MSNSVIGKLSIKHCSPCVTLALTAHQLLLLSQFSFALLYILIKVKISEPETVPTVCF